MLATGYRIARNFEGYLVISQTEYVDKLRLMATNRTFCLSTSVRMKPAYLWHTRPDVIFEVSQLSQVTVQRFAEHPKRFIRDSNKLIKAAKLYKIRLFIPSLEGDTLYLIGISDAAFGSNYDQTSQLGYLPFFRDGRNRIIPMGYKSYNAHRARRLALAAELVSFSDLFDPAFTAATEVGTLLRNTSVPVRLLTDNKFLFEVIRKTYSTSEKRLMLDIAPAREVYRSGLRLPISAFYAPSKTFLTP